MPDRRFALWLRMLLVLAALPLAARGESDTARLARQVEALLGSDTPHPFSGVVLITQGSKTLSRGARGSADRERTRALTQEARFIIGSLSKQMTAALVLREVDARRLRLDAPVQMYLPELPATWASRVRVEHLLNHTSGLEAVDRPLRSAPGEVFAYTNLGYELLGRIVEKTSGKPFAVLAEALFKVCGMRQSLAPPSGPLTTLQQRYPRLAAGFTEQEDGSLAVEEESREEASNPAGGLISTAGDLVRWNDCLHGGRLLKPATYRAMLEPTPSAKREHRWGPLAYGQGLQISNQDGLLELSHGGYVPGYLSTLIHYPGSKLNVVVLENTAWLPNDMRRAFHVHDELRRLSREYLQGGPHTEKRR